MRLNPAGRELIALGALAAAARAAYWVLATPGYVPVSDADQYHNLARNLASGHGYAGMFPQLLDHRTAFRPPA